MLEAAVTLEVSENSDIFHICQGHTEIRLAGWYPELHVGWIVF